MAAASLPARSYKRWLPWIGALIGLGMLGWLLRHFDVDRFLATLAGADRRFLLLVLLAMVAEQIVRAWKWRQLLFRLRPIGVTRLFGAIMAGYLLAFLVPFGLATVARAWLVARQENLKVTAVLATVALDRLTDGIVFACLVPVALLAVAFPDPTGGIRAGLAWGGAGSFILFALLLFALAAYRYGVLDTGALLRVVDRLPARFAGPVRRLAAAFAEGIAWPPEVWRGAGIILASVAIKLLAATHFLWAGLAFGILLEPAQYLFLIVFLGFLIILGHFARIAGSFVIAAVFVLSQFGVAEEPAVAMGLVVQACGMLAVGLFGSLALWRQGVVLADVRAAKEVDNVRCG
ncbi:MAG: flippase-like domain-containing protein [Betaproteobacteria bacterium]|nr:flippase-like domain-containing protein [Betaproteobacteria bacterium]